MKRYVQVLLIAILSPLFYWFLTHQVVMYAVVDGHSMEPTYHNSEVVAMTKLPLWIHGPRVGDVALVREFNEMNKGDGKIDMKRIVALPHQTITYVIEYPKIVVTNTLILNADEYFVEGDNSKISYDSRFYGPIHRNQVLGVAWK